METGRRLQTSSRSNERELSRNDSRLSSSRRASREEVNTPFNEHMREYQAQPDIGHAGEKEKHPTEPKDQIPEEIMAEAREELREVMIQYTSIADPSESAARKERLRRAEEQGEVDESAEQIARQLMRDQKTARGGAIPKQTQTRIPVTQRLGPSSPLAPQVEVVNEQLRIPAKKRLGRPSTKKPLGVNTAGTRTSTKRRVAPVRTSPIRKQSTRPSKPTAKVAEAATARGKRAKQNVAEAGSSNPVIKLIPAATRKKTGFHNPLAPVP